MVSPKPFAYATSGLRIDARRRMTMPRKTSVKYVLCVKNDGYPASLEIHKVYQALADEDAAEHRLVRIIDESGEDYLFPASFFVAVELPAAVKKAFMRRSRARVSA